MTTQYESTVALADRLKEVMGERTRADLARMAEVTPAAVTQWLDGTTKAIRADVAQRLGAGTGYNPVWIATGKGSKLINKDGFGLLSPDDKPEYAGRPRLSRRVPIVGTARMGDHGYYEEISSIPGAGDGHIDMATTDPDAYGLRVRGNSMAPAIRDGWYVLIEPNSAAVSGEYVLVKLRDGRRMVKELLYKRDESVEVLSVNGGERVTLYADQIESLQAVAAVISPSKWQPA